MPVASVLQSLVDAVTGLIGDHGAPAIFLLMTLESACIPVPSEVIQLFAGYLVSQGELGFIVAVLAGTLGNVAGSWIAWGVGYVGGRPFIERHGRWLHITPKRMAMADRWFERHGNAVVFWARMLPIVRTFISLPAGVARMEFWRFTLYTFLGALPWCAMLTALGWWAGSEWETIEKALKVLDYVVAAALVAGAIWLFRKWRRDRVGGGEEATAGAED